MTIAAEEIRGAMDRLVFRHPAILGYQLSVRSKGQPIVDLSVGYSTGLEGMTPDHLHFVWCGTKPLLALLVARHALFGRLELDDTAVAGVEDDFPNLAGIPCTIADVLCHNAGLAQPRAADVWMCAPDLRPSLLRDAAVGPTPAAYSEVLGWAVLAARIDQARLPAIPILQIVTGDRTESSDLVLDGRPVAAFRNRIGVHFAQRADGIRFPLLHELVPWVISSSSSVVGGLATARGLSSLYDACLPGQALGGEAALLLSRRRHPSYDATLGRECDFAAGFMIGLNHHGYGDVPEDAFGMTGWLGSSWGLALPSLDLAIGFQHNGFVGPDVNDALRSEVIAWLINTIGD
jgi:CubicO group peptidase (beta-lactamase class C family)